MIGAVALGAAIDELESIGWDAIIAHEDELAAPPAPGPGRHRRRAAPRPRARRAHPGGGHLRGRPISPTPWWRPGCRAEFGIGVRHGCFCAHPYLIRLLDLSARPDRALPRRRAGRRPSHASPARSGPAPGSRSRRRRSTGCSTRSRSSPAGRRRPSPTCRTRPRATSGRRASWRPGRPATGRWARPAPEADADSQETLIEGSGSLHERHPECPL